MAENDDDDEGIEAIAEQVWSVVGKFPLGSQEQAALISAMNALHSAMEKTDG